MAQRELRARQRRQGNIMSKLSIRKGREIAHIRTDGSHIGPV